MAKFKKGDRIVALEDSPGEFYKKGMTGTVDENDSCAPWIIWDNDAGTWAANEDRLAKIIDETTTQPEIFEILMIYTNSQGEKKSKKAVINGAEPHDIADCVLGLFLGYGLLKHDRLIIHKELKKALEEQRI